MYLFKRVSDLQAYLKTIKTGSRTIGFIPTMGALHEGHLSLIRRSKTNNTFSVCSIFVNPTQFNELSDLEKYPRTPAKDIEKLVKVGCDVLFMPANEEIYPPDDTKQPDFNFGQLDQVLEGAFRPGHFAGVARVVSRLLNIVEPDQLLMGQKDFQQLVIVRKMLQQINSPVELVMGQTVREPGGLAMSSRNERLPGALRRKATLIYQTLEQARAMAGEKNPGQIKAWALDQLSIPGFRPEYFEIVDGNSLQPIDDFDHSELIVACTAVWAGDVRLIDNIIF